MPTLPLKVLVVEDDEDDYVITRDLFTQIKGSPCELFWVQTYDAAWQAIARNEHDVYLVDYRLGGDNGLDLLREAVARGCTSPIIVLTGIGDERVDVEAIGAGAADYLVKGQITPVLLERSVTHALQRKRIEQKLRESEEQYRLLFEKNPHPIWVADRETLAFLAVNEAAIRHYGYSREEFLSMTIQDLHAPDSRTAQEDRERNRVDLPATLAGWEGVWRHRVKDGTPIDVELTFNTISFRGKTAALILANDITHRLALEAQLRQSQKMESLGTLAGGIAHDFNNILCIILGFASTLSQFRLDPGRFQRSVEAIENAIRRGSSLVKQILTFARKTEVSLEPVNVNAVVDELMKMLAGAFPKKVTLSVQMDKDLPFITGDSNQLHQSLLNLCVNSRDALPNGGELAIRTELARGGDLRAVFPEIHDGDYVCISVSDTGVGMDEAIRSRIFEPFFTTKSRDRGSGLGLAVVYGVVKSHHGFIRVESAMGRGTTFRIYLPAPTGNGTGQSEYSAPVGEAPGGTETILVVEDEEPLRELLKTLLSAKGYQVLMANDGLAAVDLYRRHRDEIALVIADIGLPKLSGYEALSRIREVQPGVRAILASGYLDPDHKSLLIESGADDFIQKPYLPSDVLARIRRALDTPKSVS